MALLMYIESRNYLVLLVLHILLLLKGTFKEGITIEQKRSKNTKEKRLFNTHCTSKHMVAKMYSASNFVFYISLVYHTNLAYIIIVIICRSISIWMRTIIL